MPDHHQTQIRALRAQARATHQRRLLLLEGEANWTLATAQALVAALLAETPLRRSYPPDPCWIGRGPAKQALSARQVLGLLGGERELIIYDLFSGLDPDALAAAAGTLRGGGLLILLGPPLSAWSDFVDPAAERIATHPYPPEAVGRRFLTRMAALLETAPGSARILEQAPIRPGRSSPAALNAPIPHSAPQGWSLTPGQQQVLAAIAQLMTERDPRPLVVSAGRGRGKSTALGLAARTLSHHGSHRILVTAPRYRAARTLLEQAQASETAPGQAAIHFQPPDQIAYAKPAADLLLIDEAAAIPAPLLRQLLEAYRRVVFATTIHGYEGTGRGFALRFFALLDARTPGWRHLELQQPLRYAAEDPLEALIDRLLLLDAEPADAARLDANAGQPVRIQPCDRQRLSQQEEGLGALFGLLRLAHYQTRPSDLRHLLDGPNLSIIGLS
jgi:tRNA(Met) cytidine acetyltransferase